MLQYEEMSLVHNFKKDTWIWHVNYFSSRHTTNKVILAKLQYVVNVNLMLIRILEHYKL